MTLIILATTTSFSSLPVCRPIIIIIIIIMEIVFYLFIRPLSLHSVHQTLAKLTAHYLGTWLVSVFYSIFRKKSHFVYFAQHIEKSILMKILTEGEIGA